MHDDTSLLDLFQAIEGKHGATPGSNADEARALLSRRVNELAGGSDVQEFHCTMQNDWDAALFHALLKRSDYVVERQKANQADLRDAPVLFLRPRQGGRTAGPYPRSSSHCLP